jgi:hypothetical protein
LGYACRGTASTANAPYTIDLKEQDLILNFQRLRGEVAYDVKLVTFRHFRLLNEVRSKEQNRAQINAAARKFKKNAESVRPARDVVVELLAGEVQLRQRSIEKGLEALVQVEWTKFFGFTNGR